MESVYIGKCYLTPGHNGSIIVLICISLLVILISDPIKIEKENRKETERNINMLITCEYDTGDNISKVKYRDGGYKKYTYDEYDNFQMNVLYNKNQTVGNE